MPARLSAAGRAHRLGNMTFRWARGCYLGLSCGATGHPSSAAKCRSRQCPQDLCGTERKRVRRLASRSLVAALPAERVAPGSGPDWTRRNGPHPPRNRIQLRPISVNVVGCLE